MGIGNLLNDSMIDYWQISNIDTQNFDDESMTEMSLKSIAATVAVL